jgi:hypothetical protein
LNEDSSTAIWKVNTLGLLAGRLLDDPESAQHFYDRGLPRLPSLAADVREYGGAGSPTLQNPRFQRWLADEWRPAYVSFLLSRPGGTLTKPVLESREELEPFDYGEDRRVIPAAIAGLLIPEVSETGDDEFVTPFTFLLLAAMALSLASFAARRPTVRELLPWGLLAACYAWIFLTWHLAAFELVRLEVPVSVATRITAILMVVWAIDRSFGPAEPDPAPSPAGS